MSEIEPLVDFLHDRLDEVGGREADTGRRLIGAWRYAVDNERRLGVPGRISYESGKVAAAEIALRIVADGWRDRADYRPEWGVLFVRVG